MRKMISIWCMMFIITAVEAQTLSVNAPHQVNVGEQFQIEYEVNSQDVHSFHPGNIPDGIEILYGPSTSTQSSFQMVNGHTNSSSSTTITYIARATKRGTFTMPAAHVVVGGKTVNAAAFKIQAQGAGHVSSHRQSSAVNPVDEARRHAAAVPQGEDLFIRVSANKYHVREQEPILLSYKVYTLVDLTQLNGKVPDLKGFHTQEIKLPAQKTFQHEEVNGRTYNTVTWSQYVMYPQMTGKLEIPPITFHGIVLQQVRDPFSFFSGGGYEEVRRDIKAPGVTITVDPLPTRPKDFSGGVGHFNISAQLTEDDYQTGTPMNLRVVVGGAGNLKLIKKPSAHISTSFEVYDPKVTDKTKLTAKGIEGNMVYDYMIVPQETGRLTIPPFTFTYFDTLAGQYKTIKTQAFDVDIRKGNDESAASKSAVADTQNETIRPLKTTTSLFSGTNSFFGSLRYWIIVILLFLIWGIILLMFRKTAADRSDVARLKGKNANKVATRRLRIAALLKTEGRSSDFYDEVLKALWGYIGDRLSMPVEQLSRDNISEQLTAQQVPADTIELFLHSLDECEYERYAPGDSAGNMDKTYASAVKAIMNIEQAMKYNRMNKNRGAGAHTVISVILFLLPTCNVSAITKNNADSEYQKGNYLQAIHDYEELLKEEPTAELYYNLGNAYYKNDNIARAILAYERAQQLSPGDEDTRFNLEMANAKTIDKIVPQSEMFLLTWAKALVCFLNSNGWAYLAIASLLLLIVLTVTWLLADSMLWRGIGFYGAVCCLLLFILSNIFACIQDTWLHRHDGAIVMSSSVTVRQSPATTAKEAFVLHEGTRVDITDRSMKGWLGIQLINGREGWIDETKVEEITVHARH